MMPRKKKVTEVEAWRQLTERFIDVGKAIIQEAEVTTKKKTADPRVICIVLLLRSLTNSLAAIQLLERGLIVEARVMVRCCLENLFWVEGLVAQGDAFVRKMRDNDMRMLLSNMENAMAFPQLATSKKAGIRAEIQKILQQAPNIRKAKLLNPKDVATGGLFSSVYRAYTLLSDDAAHPTTRSLSRYIQEKKNNISWVPAAVTPVESAQTVFLVCLGLMGVCVGTNQILKGTQAGRELKALAAQYDGIRSKYETKTTTFDGTVRDRR
jgi:hypothetical protein